MLSQVSRTRPGAPGQRSGVKSSNMEPYNVRDVIEKLDRIDQWLCERGLKKHDRIRIHKRNLTQLADAQDDEEKFLPFFDGLPDEKRREMIWSIVEADEFVKSLDDFGDKKNEIPRELLKKALLGPADLFQEDETSNIGRNTMFEILFGGVVASVGLHPRLGKEPDVSFEFDNCQIFVQCKRVLSEARVEERVSEAAKQLQRDLAQSSNGTDCGLVAISLSRLINPGNRLLNVPSVSDADNVLRREIRSVIDGHKKGLLGCAKDPKVAGILLHMSTPAWIMEEGKCCVVRSMTAFPMSGCSDSALLTRLAGFLKI